MKLAAGALLVVGACFNPTFNNPACGPNGECPPGTQCDQGICRSASPDDAHADDANDCAPDDGRMIDAAIDAPAPFAGCQSTADLVACYRFEAGGTVADDQTANNNDAPCSGGTSIVVGKVGNAMQFNGGNAGCTVPHNATQNTPVVTLAAWMNVNAIPAGGSARYGIVDKDVSYALHFYGDKTLRCNIGTGQLASAILTIQPGQWTHIACTYDQTMIRLYQDGAQVGMQPASGPIPNNPTPFAVGMNSPSGDNMFGKLDELKVWRRALTASEICDEVGC